MSMWEPFTAEARDAMVRAQNLAEQYGSESITKEHIFVAVTQSAAVGRILTEMGITAEDVLHAAEPVFGQKRSTPSHDFVFSPEAKRLIELAFENARKLDTRFIGVEHLALGYLALGENRTDVLKALRANCDDFRSRLHESLAAMPKSLSETAVSHAEGAPSFVRVYQRTSGFAKRLTLAEVWSRLQAAAEQKDLAGVLVYAMSAALHDGSTYEDVLKRVASRLRELSG